MKFVNNLLFNSYKCPTCYILVTLLFVTKLHTRSNNVNAWWFELFSYDFVPTTTPPTTGSNLSRSKCFYRSYSIQERINTYWSGDYGNILSEIAYPQHLIFKHRSASHYNIKFILLVQARERVYSVLRSQ